MESGLSEQLVTIMDDAAKLSSADPGTLVQEAGAAGLALDKNNNLTNQIKDIELKIKDLKAKYEKERERYWKQFSDDGNHALQFKQPEQLAVPTVLLLNDEVKKWHATLMSLIKNSPL